MESKDIATVKSRELAVKIVNLYKNLCSEKKEFVISRQILKAGKSIGANLAEAQYAFSENDYLFKKSIALKECSETLYWLELLKETGYIAQSGFEALSNSCKEILKLLITAVKSLKTNKG